MIAEVKRIIEEILAENNEQGNIEIKEDSQLSDLGLSSFDLATLTVKIEDEFDFDIFEDGLVSTVGEIVAILTSNK